MPHPRNMPKQDLKAQYYSRRRSSVALNLNSSSSPPLAAGAGVSSSASPSISSPLNITITVRQEAMMNDKGDQTVEKLMNKAGNVLKEWEIKKGTPTPTMKVRTTAEDEVKEATSSPMPKLRSGAGYYRDGDGKVKPLAVVEVPMPDEMGQMEKVEAEVMDAPELGKSLAILVEDNADAAAMEDKDEAERRMEVLSITNSSSPAPAAVSLQTIENEKPPSPSASPPELNPSVPAIPSPPARPPIREPNPAANIPAKVSAPAGPPKEWKPKHKIHDWFCASHKACASSLDPYKCTRCTKRRAEAKSLVKK